MTVEFLMDLDRAFCETTGAQGAKGWAHFFKEDGIMVTKNGPNIVGQQTCQERMKPFFDNEKSALIWEPEGGGISGDGELGYTYGHYKRAYPNKEGVAQEETGRYLTVWRRIDEETYRVEIDLGN